MKDYYYIVTVTCDSSEEADQVMAERISPNEDYGFDYSIDWDYSHSDTPNGVGYGGLSNVCPPDGVGRCRTNVLLP